MQLTDKEHSVMQALMFNNYGENGDGVWSWAVNDSDKPSCVSGKELSGVVGSLAKKGLLSSEEYERNQAVIYLTKAGREYMAEKF